MQIGVKGSIKRDGNNANNRSKTKKSITSLSNTTQDTSALLGVVPLPPKRSFDHESIDSSDNDSQNVNSREVRLFHNKSNKCSKHSKSKKQPIHNKKNNNNKGM